MGQWPTENADELKLALGRLMEENSRWRKLVDEVQVIIRQRSSKADGLTLPGGIKTILDERDKALDRNQFWRTELKKILSLLLEDKISDAKKELNTFLYKNPK